ncbi:MAG TPA: hypothetical protein VI278_07100 [Nitrososphaeraceae archaeon]
MIIRISSTIVLVLSLSILLTMFMATAINNNYLTSSLAQTQNVFVSNSKELNSNNNTTTNTSIGNTATLKYILE